MLIGNGRVCTFAEPFLLEDGAVYVEGGVIRELGRYDALAKKYGREDFIDARRGLIMPGLINAHTHLYSTLARGIPVEGKFRGFVDILKKLWWRLDSALTPGDVYYSALVGALDCLRRGVTTVFDHHSSPSYIHESLDLVGKACREVGLRACLSYEVSDRHGARKATEAICENERWLARCERVGLAGAFGLHASFTLAEKTLARAHAVCEKYDTGFHVHLAEAPEDVALTQKRYRRRPVARLLRAGILRPKTIAAHCVHVGAREASALARAGVFTVHNPASNLNNRVGTAPVAMLLERGVLVGLGTDGFGQDVLHEFRLAHLVHPRLGLENAGSLLFVNNARIATAYFRRTLGRLVRGAYADILVLDYKNPTPISAQNFYSHLLFGLAAANITHVIVGGVLVREGRKFMVDVEDVMRRARARAEALWARW